MFERFTRGARDVVVGAQAEARRLRHARTGTEHLLLAILRAGDETSDLLRVDGITADRVDAAIARAVGSRPGTLGPEDAAALRALGIDLDEVRARIEENLGPLPPDPPAAPQAHRRWGFGRRRRPGRASGADDPAVSPTGHIPFSPRAKKVLELSLREAVRLKCRVITPGHLLLGVLRDNEGLAAKILADAGLDFADLRGRLDATLRENHRRAS